MFLKVLKERVLVQTHPRELFEASISYQTPAGHSSPEQRFLMDFTGSQESSEILWNIFIYIKKFQQFSLDVQRGLWLSPVCEELEPWLKTILLLLSDLVLPQLSRRHARCTHRHPPLPDAVTAGSGASISNSSSDHKSGLFIDTWVCVVLLYVPFCIWTDLKNTSLSPMSNSLLCVGPADSFCSL